MAHQEDENKYNNNVDNLETLSNEITYRFMIDSDGIVHVYERETSENIHEREKEYDNANRERPDSIIEELWVGQGDRSSGSNFSQNGRKSRKDDTNDNNFVSGEGRSNRTGYSKDRANAYREPKKRGWHFNEDGSVDVTYNDGTQKKENIAPTNEVSSTDDAFFDGKKSLSAEGETPKSYGKWNVRGEDILLKSNIAPVQEDVSSVTEDNVAPVPSPVTEEEANARQGEILSSLTDADAPPEVEAPFYGESEAVAPDDPFENRDIKEVGNKAVKAYMFENPEVKPYFRDEANIMLGELRDTVKGERYYTETPSGNMNAEYGAESYGYWSGTSRQTSPDIAYLLDSVKMSYADIEKGLNAIIEDHGAENIAAAKKIEFILNDRLLNGYQTMDGYDIPANQDYIKLLNEKQILEYNEEARKKFFEVAEVLPSTPKTEKKGSLWQKIRTLVFDKQSTIEDISLKAHNRELMGKADFMLRSESRAQRHIKNKLMPNIVNKNVFKSHLKYINAIKENSKEFSF